MSPPDPSPLAEVERATRARLRRLAARIAADHPVDAALLTGAARTRTRVRPERSPLLGELRAIVAGFEAAGRIADLARRAEAGAAAAIAELFAEVATTTHLRTLAPQQVPDSRFVTRSARLAERLEAEARAELPLGCALLADIRESTGRLALTCRVRHEQATRPGEYPLGASRFFVTAPLGTQLTLELRADEALVRVGRKVALRFDRDRPAAASGGGGVRLRERVQIADSGLWVGRRLVSRPGSLRVGRPLEGAADRLSAAFELLAYAWPEGAEDVRRFSDGVIPLDEPGTVSYSLPSRPGYSYVNLRGKSLIQLADDLLHEAAHHQLHLVEELDPLVADADGNPRWWSPWRRAWRPLRGLFHACYTFTHGALLFERLLDSDTPTMTRSRRRFAARRLLEEEASLEFSLADLELAGDSGELTTIGAALAEDMTELFRGQIRPATRAARRLITAPDREALAVLRRQLRHRRRASPGQELALGG